MIELDKKLDNSKESEQSDDNDSNYITEDSD